MSWWYATFGLAEFRTGLIQIAPDQQYVFIRSAEPEPPYRSNQIRTPRRLSPLAGHEGEVGEQATLFFSDPSGNHLEFKAFRNIDAELLGT